MVDRQTDRRRRHRRICNRTPDPGSDQCKKNKKGEKHTFSMARSAPPPNNCTESRWLTHVLLVSLAFPLFFKISMDSPPDTSFPRTDSDELPKILLDVPHADIVLHSNDSHSFRVLKIDIVGCSTILGELIQAASDSSGAANPARAKSEKQLPRNKSRPKKKEKKSTGNSLKSSYLIAVPSFPVCSLLSPQYCPSSHLLSRKRWNFYQ